MFFIFGGNGWGNRGQEMEGIATREAVNRGFQYNQLDNGVRAIQNGLCDGFYAINNALKDGFYAVVTSQKDCCCESNRNIDSVKYEMSKGFCDVIQNAQLNTRDILESQNAGVQKILDYMCANEKQTLRDRIATLETSGIIQAQTQNLVAQLQPVAKPAYLVNSPYASYNPYPFSGLYGSCGFGGYGIGY